MSLSVVLAISSVALVACGVADAPTGGQQPDELIARAMVLQDKSHGPQLCLGGVAESYPPQCGGPDLIGWDWADVTGFEHANNTRWGEYVVVGRYDQDAYALRLTRPAVPAKDYRGPRFGPAEPESVWSTPCKTPAGGWRVIDPARATDEAMNQAMQAAQSRRDFAGLWLDQSINPAAKGGDSEANAERMNDPTRLILNVAVTGDVVQAEKDLRKTWGGSLCVSRAEHTDRELQRIQQAIPMKRDVLSTSAGRDVVDVGVVWDDGRLQEQFDDRFGAGAVRVQSALVPVPD